MGEVIKLRVASSEEAITLQSASGSLAVEAVSPRVTLERVSGGTQMSVTDIDGTQTTIIPDGRDGAIGPIGPSGATGQTGVGIATCELLDDYRLMITYTNGTYEIVGPIRGAQGEIGPIGPSGAPGTSGVGIVYCELLQDYRLQITYSNGTYDIVGPIRGPQGEAGTDGTDGTDGVTFTPSVSNEGIISWTNDGGRANPQSVNIKGPKGDTGDTGPQGDDYVLTDADKTEIAGKTFAPMLLPASVLSEGYFVRYDNGGTFPYSNTTYGASTYVDVSGWSKIRYKRTKTNGASSYAGMAFYYADKTFISNSGVQTVVGQDSIGYYGMYEVSVPENAKYARFTMLTDAQTYGSFEVYGLRNALAFDASPTANSVNAVTSGGVYAAISATADPVTVETVSGTDPVIVGADNHRYVCGTVDTLTLTPPSSGIVDVVFTSGTTPTVLSVPNTIKWPGWFDPTSLDASTTYELNIMDGVYGAVAAWT